MARRADRRQARLFNGLCTLLILLVLVLLASALRRMGLYEDAYGYTHLRLYVHIFMLWLAAAFVWLLVALWARPDRFAVGGFVAALGFLVTVNLVNPDASIAQQNLARYRATGKLDVAYLSSAVSEDGVPALVAALPGTSGAVRAALRADLRRRLAGMERDPTRRDWPSFVLARRQAYDALTGSRAHMGMR